jgi:NADH:ubiquinone oxidoreductase subunit
MSLINNFFIMIFSKKVGQDQLGNKYYENKKKNYLGVVRRQVIYQSEAEASKVTPMWHAWLHYLIDEIPSSNNNYLWQQDYLLDLENTKNNTVIDVKYNKWQPFR